jgi:thiamine biosynthesis lipoprotein
MHKGKKLLHILNPRTAWPVNRAPLTISVEMPQCLQAGLLSTLSTLKGRDAETFLEAQGITYWIQR